MQGQKDREEKYDRQGKKGQTTISVAENLPLASNADITGKSSPRILVIEDDTQDIALIRHYLRRTPRFTANLKVVKTISEGLERLQENNIDVVLLDLNLPDGQGLEAFREVYAQCRQIPIVILSGLDDEKIALESLHEGAQDYLIKGKFDGNLLVRAIRYAIERQNLRLLKEQINEELESRVQERTLELQQTLRQLQEMEVQLRQSLAAEKEVSELKSRIIATISHEFRTPLTKILASSELLEANINNWQENKQLKYLWLIQKSADEMASIIKNVLFLNKTEFEKLEFQPNPINLERFLTKIIEEVKLFTDYPGEITFTNGEVHNSFWGDANLLRQIMTNLLTNSIKYSPQGNQIAVKLLAEPEQIIISINDRGIGIPQADQGRLFEPFSRASNVGTIPGIGLGLAIVKKAVELHRGTISLQSVVEVGTTVTVTFPLNNK